MKALYLEKPGEFRAAEIPEAVAKLEAGEKVTIDFAKSGNFTVAKLREMRARPAALPLH